MCADVVRVDLLPGGRPGRRGLVERLIADEAALVRTVPERSDLLATTHPACIVDISVKGAGLRVPAVVDLTPGTPIDLGLDGSWSRARVVWSRPGWHDDLVAGVEFTDADPAFLTALARWLDNYAAWRDVGDRRHLRI
jgi:hypothetical protein